MSLAIAIARSGIAVVLLAAGAAKLVDLRNFRPVVASLGVPAWLANPVATLLVACELAVGGASLSSMSIETTDVAVVALTGLFVAVNFLALKRLPAFRCRCFGALGTTRFGPRALAHSLALTGVAVGVLVASQAGLAEPGSAPGSTVLVVAGATLFAFASAQAARAVQLIQEGSDS
jgi:hypothetical protein